MKNTTNSHEILLPGPCLIQILMWGESTKRLTRPKKEIDKVLSSIKFMMDPFKICMEYLSNFLGL